MSISLQTLPSEISTSEKRNAVILAAGTSSRFVPLSQERPKGLLEVKGEILIERQIRQLNEAGIDDITIVTGYKSQMFEYLKDKFGVRLVLNKDYERYNNTSSMIRVVDRLNNTYICSSDNYFPRNVFKENPDCSYYSALYAEGESSEYCMTIDNSDIITGVTVGGKNKWYMIGHVYFSSEFSKKFKSLLIREYEKEDVRLGYWEDLFINNIKNLPAMKIHRYTQGDIEEFDSLEELRLFDSSYIYDTRSSIIKDIAVRLGCKESDLRRFQKASINGTSLVFSFSMNGNYYIYNQADNSLSKI